MKKSAKAPLAADPGDTAQRQGDQLGATTLQRGRSEKCQQPTIAAQLHQRHGHWIGHVLRMGDERFAKWLLYSELPGKQPQGRPGCSLKSVYQKVLNVALNSQELKSIAEAAADKVDWNEKFAA